MKHECEHCGSYVTVAKVCPKCGRDHGHEFFEEAGIVSICWVLVFIMWVLIYFIDKIFDFSISTLLSMFVISIPVSVMIAVYLLVKKKVANKPQGRQEPKLVI